MADETQKPCSKCRERPRRRGGRWCLECNREYQRNWARKKYGCKPQRYSDPVDGKLFCQACKDWKPIENFAINSGRRNGRQAFCKSCNSKRHKTDWQALRMEVLAHYSCGDPHCACCGERTLEFLALDHIEGGGNEHKKSLGISGSHIYRWIKSRGFPAGFRVLCHNCNQSRGFYGYCPHERMLKVVS